MDDPDPDVEIDRPVSRWAFIPDWFRKLSWFVIAGGFLLLGNAELGIPPNKFPWRPQPPLAELRMRYLIVFAVGLPGAVGSVVRAATRKQRTPWGDWD